MGRGRDMDKETVIMAGGCCCCVVVITSIILIILSFGYISELEYCLEYNTITRVVESKVSFKPGTHFTGIDHDFLCFPSQSQRLSFSGSSGLLAARSLEGLTLHVDIQIEYQLNKANVKTLFDLVELKFHPLFRSIAESSLRNVAAQYSAMEFLNSTRAQIAQQMHTDLDTRLIFDGKKLAVVKEVQMFHVDLEDAYEGWIRAIETEKLTQEQRRQERNVDIVLEENNRVRQTIALKALRKKTLIDAETDVRKAQLEQAADITEAQTAAAVQLLEAERDRKTTLIGIQSQLAVVTAQRAGDLQAALNSKGAAVIDFRRELIQARAQANVTKMNADAASYRTRVIGAADAEKLRLEKEAALQQFLYLKNNATMNTTDLLRYAWLDTLKDYEGAKFFLDYKKVPMLLESEG
jgi:hypothetical protein